MSRILYDLARASLAVAAFAAACAPSDPRQPAPDLSAIVTGYNSPDGTFTSSDELAVKSTVQSELAVINDLALDKIIIDALNAAFPSDAGAPDAGAPDAGATPKTIDFASVPTNRFAPQGLPLGIRGAGFARVTRICPGWDPKPVVNEALNGKIDLQMNASTNGIDTVIWAQLTRCRYTVGSLRISIDKGTATDGGDLAVTMGLQYFEVQEVQTRPLIIRANLMASVNDSPPSSVNFDFRVTPDPVGASLRVRVSDGYVVAETDRQQLFSISAKNGTFDCNPGDGTCDSASGSVVPLFR